MTKRGGWPPTGFAQQLQGLRERAGLTQGELAKRAGCTTMTISKLERAVQEPAWPLVLAIASALGVSCLAFLPSGEGTEQPKRKRGRPPRPSG